MDENARRRESDEKHRRREIWRIAQALNLTYCDVAGNEGISDGHCDHYYDLGIKFTPQFLKVVNEILTQRAFDQAEYDGEMAHQMSVLSGQASGRTL
mgnify:CR=1 FL=1